jgi:CHAT domain-containing protein/tetratricopeptide (TPR) repeat protein
MGRALAGALAVVVLGGAALLGERMPSSSISVSTPADLRPGMSVSSDLKSPASATYPIQLATNDFLRVVVEQQGIDLVVSLLDPAGRELFVTDRRNHDSGPEPVEVVAKTTGLHRLRVSARQPGLSGRYVVRLEERHPASPRDRTRARATGAFARGEALGVRGDFAGAEKAYQAAFLDWNTVQDVRGMAEAQDRLGGVAKALRNPVGARRAYEKAAALYGEINDPRQIEMLIDAGQFCRVLGQPGAAEASYLKALRLARQRADRLQEGTALNNLGVLYHSEAEPRKALDAYDQALAIWKSLNDTQEIGSTLHNIGAAYTVLGRLPQARELLEQSLGWRRSAATLTAIGWIHSLEGNSTEALRLYDEALRLRRSQHDRSGEAVTLDRRGTALRQMGRMAEALAAYEQALRIFREIGETPRMGPTLSNLGWLKVETGDPGRAEQLLKQAFPLLHESGDRHGEAHALLGLAYAARQRGNTSLALSHVEASIALVESLREESPGPDLRLSYGAMRYGYRELWIDLLMELHAREPKTGYDLRALEASERGRARGLLETLGQADKAGVQSGSTPRALEARIRKLESLLLQPQAEGVPPDRLEEVEKKLSVLLLERDWRRDKRPAARPQRRRILLDLRELLGSDTLLLEYAVGEERSFLWLVGAEGLEVTRILPGRKELSAQVRAAREPLSEGFKKAKREPVQVALAALGQTLIEPVADRLGNKRLLIVPDDVLHGVPFSALPVRPGGPPLVIEHEIVVAPSAATVVRIRRELPHRPPVRGDVALVAAPEFGSGVNAPAPLPQTRKEADAIFQLLPDRSRSKALLGFDANLDAVLGGALDGHQIVHFATHAIVDFEQPELSHLVLTMIDRDGHPREGRLRAYEIRDLHLSADTVVLSACSTAVGQELRGEGPLGLSLAFLDAGAARVVVSLWDVQDQPTAELMQRFYRGVLIDHLSPAAALRQAQISMARETRWAAPYYWAGFELQGEWR